jgi:FlaA1/EpsC-like NDP-sugar epimerase
VYDRVGAGPRAREFAVLPVYLRRALRLLAELTVDAAVVIASYYAGFLLRFDGKIPQESLDTFARVAPLIVAAYLLAGYVFGVYRTAWQYGGLGDVLRIVRAVLLVTVIIFLFNRTRAERDIPLSVNLIAGALTLLAMTFWKMTPRLVAHRPRSRRHAASKRLLIVGAGNTGQLVAREFLQHRDWEYRPICFADDDPGKRRKRIHGLPVAGGTGEIPDLVHRFGIDVVALALPSAPGAKVRELVTVCQAAGVPVRMVPGLPELVQDPHLVSHLREVRVEDLIGREQVEIDYSQCLESLRNRVVLITGAAGSIGAELARQVLSFGPAALHLLDNNETGLYELRQELQSAGHGAEHVDLRLWPADVTDGEKMRRVLAAVGAQVVFHAAAYKHVALMEEHPDEAFRVNVLGTRNVFRAAEQAGAERVVFITTDKAVKPVSAYGATKRIGELLVPAMAQRSATVFCAVRFGNVIGSRGSVVPIFTRQIQQGGPVGVTDPEAARYFLTIPEAVSLVIQAAAFAAQGQVFMLDMGEEVRILDLAEKMIRMKGLTPGADVPIVYTGLRPGEKVREELVADHEHPQPTRHPKVLLTFNGGRVGATDLDEAIDALAATPNLDRTEFIRRMHRLARMGPATVAMPSGSAADER